MRFGISAIGRLKHLSWSQTLRLSIQPTMRNLRQLLLMMRRENSKSPRKMRRRKNVRRRTKQRLMTTNQLRKTWWSILPMMLQLRWKSLKQPLSKLQKTSKSLCLLRKWMQGFWRLSTEVYWSQSWIRICRWSLRITWKIILLNTHARNSGWI